MPEASQGPIVVIDDEKIILEVTSMVLRKHGFSVVTADSAEKGLALIEREVPILALLDYMMPVMDGMTALRAIRERFPDTYVIMFTGKGNEEIAVELMKAGASDYILKPFNNHDLIERIENVLRIRRIELHNRELRQERERLLGEIETWNRELERRVEQKTRELERAHDEIVQGEKLVALGHLSAGMAHEIRNPLNSISLFGQVLRTRLSGDSELSGYVDKILKEVDRIDDSLVNLLNASKRPRYELKLVNLQDIVARALESVKERLAAQHVELEYVVATAPPPMLADPREFEQIFSNLVANALYEMKEGGRLGIKIWHDGISAFVVVSDTGRGIPKENQSQIFDPFFTTKEKGTGFGLSVVLRIVKSYGGRISLESSPGQGSVFKIELPLE